MMSAPGLALFYGGLVRRKNVLGTMMQTFAMMGVITVLWALVDVLAGVRRRATRSSAAFHNVLLHGVGWCRTRTTRRRSRCRPLWCTS